MNISTITRNAENQVASVLKGKVERFMSSKKDRLQKAQEILHLADQLGILVRKNVANAPEWPAREPLTPLPPKSRKPSVLIDDNLPPYDNNLPEVNRHTD